MFLELLLLLLTLVLLDYWVHRRGRKLLKNIPVVSKVPVVGCCAVLATLRPDNLHLKFGEFVGRFGKSFYARILQHTVVVTADPHHVDQLLGSHVHLRKNILYHMLRPWLGNGLLLSYGQKWQTMRKIITPTFHFKILEQFVDVFNHQSIVLIDKLKAFADGETALDIYPFIGLATLDIITETAMGVQINAQYDSKSDFVVAVKDVTESLANRFVRPNLAHPLMYRVFEPSMYQKEKDGIAVMHAFTERIIEERRLKLKSLSEEEYEYSPNEDFNPKRRMALLDVLLYTNEADSQKLSDQQIRDEVNTFMFEGHDTTTSATSFCLYLISRHGACQQRLFNEVRNHFPDSQQPIVSADLHDLTYLNCVIKESLRLYPTIPAVGRWIQEDFQLYNCTLPANTNVIVLLWELLHDPQVYEEPEAFRPERHLENNPKANTYSNIPFSAGPRNCIGKRFALLEMKIMIIKILQQFELVPLGKNIEPIIKIVLRSKTGVNLGIKLRQY